MAESVRALRTVSLTINDPSIGELDRTELSNDMLFPSLPNEPKQHFGLVNSVNRPQSESKYLPELEKGYKIRDFRRYAIRLFWYRRRNVSVFRAGGESRPILVVNLLCWK